MIDWLLINRDWLFGLDSKGVTGEFNTGYIIVLILIFWDLFGEGV